MPGIQLWRCSRCSNESGTVFQGAKLLCGDCFYRQTVERIMAAAFLPEPVQVAPSVNDTRSSARTSTVIPT